MKTVKAKKILKPIAVWTCPECDNENECSADESKWDCWCCNVEYVLDVAPLETPSAFIDYSKAVVKCRKCGMLKSTSEIVDTTNCEHEFFDYGVFTETQGICKEHIENPQ